MGCGEAAKPRCILACATTAQRVVSRYHTVATPPKSTTIAAAGGGREEVGLTFDVDSYLLPCAWPISFTRREGKSSTCVNVRASSGSCVYLLHPARVRQGAPSARLTRTCGPLGLRRGATSAALWFDERARSGCGGEPLQSFTPEDTLRCASIVGWLKPRLRSWRISEFAKAVRPADLATTTESRPCASPCSTHHGLSFHRLTFL